MFSDLFCPDYTSGYFVIITEWRGVIFKSVDWQNVCFYYPLCPFVWRLYAWSIYSDQYGRTTTIAPTSHQDFFSRLIPIFLIQYRGKKKLRIAGRIPITESMFRFSSMRYTTMSFLKTNIDNSNLNFISYTHC